MESIREEMEIRLQFFSKKGITGEESSNRTAVSINFYKDVLANLLGNSVKIELISWNHIRSLDNKINNVSIKATISSNNKKSFATGKAFLHTFLKRITSELKTLCVISWKDVSIAAEIPATKRHS